MCFVCLFTLPFNICGSSLISFWNCVGLFVLLKFNYFKQSKYVFRALHNYNNVSHVLHHQVLMPSILAGVAACRGTADDHILL